MTSRSEEAVNQLRAARGGVWPLIRSIRRRRPLLTAVLVLAAPVHTLLTGVRPLDLLDPQPTVRFVLAWVLMLFGVGVRIWGAGNLRKNQEITQTGIYHMVRHPLYVGSLAMFLAFYLTVSEPVVGLALFLALVGLVYYPTMLGEEEYLALKFPEQAATRARLPRLLPNPLRLGEALRTDRFSLSSANANLGLRSLWFLLLLPLLLRVLIWLQARV